MRPGKIPGTAKMVAAACVLGLAIAACGGGESAGPATTPGVAAETTDAPQAAPDPTSEVAESSEIVPALLQFSAPLVGGGQIDASTLADKPTVFWFWSPT